MVAIKPIKIVRIFKLVIFKYFFISQFYILKNKFHPRQFCLVSFLFFLRVSSQIITSAVKNKSKYVSLLRDAKSLL